MEERQGIAVAPIATKLKGDVSVDKNSITSEVSVAKCTRCGSTLNQWQVDRFYDCATCQTDAHLVGIGVPMTTKIKGDDSMNICLKCVDGSIMSYNEKGILLKSVDADGTVLDADSNGIRDIVGLWHDDNGHTLSWDLVVTDIKNGNLLLDGCLYVDNGQVIEEGQVVGILVDGVSILPNTGGRDVSGYTGDNNVYCESCEVEYEIKAEHAPKYCSFCGSVYILTKEDF